MDALLEAVEVEEVAFQAGCQASELRAILTSALAGPQRKLAATHSRIRKHLGATAPKLAAQVLTLCFRMSFLVIGPFDPSEHLLSLRGYWLTSRCLRQSSGSARAVEQEGFWDHAACSRSGFRAGVATLANRAAEEICAAGGADGDVLSLYAVDALTTGTGGTL